ELDFDDVRIPVLLHHTDDTRAVVARYVRKRLAQAGQCGLHLLPSLSDRVDLLLLSVALTLGLLTLAGCLAHEDDREHQEDHRHDGHHVGERPIESGLSPFHLRTDLTISYRSPTWFASSSTGSRSADDD